MSLIGKAGERFEYELPPAGTTIGICYRVLDLGTQPRSFQGEEKEPAPVVQFTFELPMLTMSKGDYAGKPFAIGSKKFPVFMTENAGLRKFLESWQGGKFSEPEAKAGVDFSAYLLRPALLNIVHQKAKDSDNVYAVINTISPVMQGMSIPPLVNTPVIFDLDNFNETVYNSLSENLRKLIAQSPEYIAAMNKRINGQQYTHSSIGTAVAYNGQPMPADAPLLTEDDIPF